MKQKKPYDPPKIIDLQVDYTQAVGVTKCNTGPTATGVCSAGNQATSSCGVGSGFRAADCGNGNRATNNCKTGSSAG
jgi:hypothetical protein